MLLEVGYKEYKVEIDGIQLFFKCHFNPLADEAVLFIHGLACSSTSFRNLFDAEYFPGKSLLLVDLAGFGNSSKPADFSYTMEEQAGLLTKLLNILPKWKLHIAAHSMGNAIGLLLDDSILSRVESYSNVEGNMISEDCGLLSRGIAGISFEEYRDTLFPIQLAEFNGHGQLEFSKSSPVAIYKSASSLVHWSDNGQLLERFLKRNCRKSYFYGEENKEMVILEKLKGIPQIMITDSGHSMTTENPREFYSKLSDFIYAKD